MKCESSRRSSPHRARAFTLIELLLVIVIIALLVGILLPALASARETARVAVCMAGQKQQITGLLNYTTDTKAFLPMYSWTRFNWNQYSEFADLGNPGTDVQAAADQAVTIVRKNLGYTAAQQPRVTNRMLQRNFSYLPAFSGGYFGDRLPEPGVICPKERDALVWQRQRNLPDPTVGTFLANNTFEPAAYKKFLPYWTTYQMVPNTWSPERPSVAGEQIISQASGGQGNHLLYASPNTARFTNRRIDYVQFPSQKVWLFDLYDRHSSARREFFYASPQAKQPLAFFDGQVSMRETRKANRGWNPLTPQSANPTTYLYFPQAHEPRTVSGNASETVTGYYRWTRSGLRGVDYGGGEIAWTGN